MSKGRAKSSSFSGHYAIACSFTETFSGLGLLSNLLYIATIVQNFVMKRTEDHGLNSGAPYNRGNAIFAVLFYFPRYSAFSLTVLFCEISRYLRSIAYFTIFRD